MPTLAIRKTCNPTGNIVTYQGKMANETIKCVPVSRAEDIELVRNENSLVSIFSEVKIHSYKLNVKDKLSQKLIDLQKVSVCEEKDGGRHEGGGELLCQKNVCSLSVYLHIILKPSFRKTKVTA